MRGGQGGGPVLTNRAVLDWAQKVELAKYDRGSELKTGRVLVDWAGCAVRCAVSEVRPSVVGLPVGPTRQG